MTTALTAYTPGTFDQALTFADRIAGTAIVPRDLRNKPDEVFAVMATADSLGIHPMSGLRGIHVIQGRPTLSADLMMGLALGAGVQLRYAELSESRVIVEVSRPGFLVEPVRVEWTMEMAQRAGLAGKENWRKFPRAMLKARALAEACRLAAPDVLHGVYVPDELEAIEAPTPASTPPREVVPEVIDVYTIDHLRDDLDDIGLDLTMVRDYALAQDLPDPSTLTDPARLRKVADYARSKRDDIRSFSDAMDEAAQAAEPEPMPPAPTDAPL